MTLTATYVDDLSRVRLSVTGAPPAADYAILERSVDQVTWTTVRGGDTVPLNPLAAVLTDSFSRTVASGWGSTPTGQAWTMSGGTATDYTVNGSAGLISFAAVNSSRWETTDAGVSDVDETVSVSTSAVATGASIAVWLTARMADLSNFYAARLDFQTDGLVTVRLLKAVAGTESTLVTSASLGAYTAGVPWKIRLYVAGSQLHAKAWRSDTSEPAPWTLDATDTAITGGTLVGVRGRLITGNTNALPVTLSFDDLTVTPAGQTGKLDDYEFAPGVPNFYRASYVDSAPITLVGTGTAVTGNNTSLLPGSVPGVVAGDLLVVLASIRNSGTGTVNVPAGWTKLVDAGNMALLGKIAAADGEAIPTITYSGGVANADTIAQAAAFRNAALIPAASNTQLNASAQNINYPALNVPGDNHLVLIAGWKQDDWTSTSAPTTKLGESSVVTGDDAGQVWCYLIETSEADVVPFNFTVTGGVAAISRGITAAFQRADYISRDTATITPNMPVIWLKNPRRPNLNTKITVTDWGTITKPARAGVFDVIGRTYPIAVTDVRGSRRYTLTVTTVDLGAAEELDARLAQGDPVLLHVPPDCPFPGGYYTVGDVSIDRHSKRTLRRFFDLPLTEVAAPAGTIYSTTVTYGDILAAYATYADLLAAEPTYSDVLDYIAPAGNVIVP